MLINNEFPEDLVVQILLWLPVISLSRFKCVCKSWNALISDQTFVYKHLLHSQSPSNKNKTTLLLVNRRDKTTFHYVVSAHFYETLQVSRTHTLPSPYYGIDNKVNVFIVGSCNGLVCLYYNYDLNTVLWNPATNETKVIPKSNIPRLPVDYRTLCNGIGFGFDAKTHEDKIIRLFRLCEPDSSLAFYEMKVIYHSEIYSLSTDSWRQIDSPPCEIREGFRGMKTNLNGIGSWWAWGDDWLGILSFDISNEVFLTTQMPDESVIGYDRHARLEFFFLLNESVALAIASLYEYEVGSDMCWDIWLLLEYGVKESWTKLFTIDPLTGPFRPLEFWRNDTLFLEKSDGQLVLYDASTKELTNLQIDGALVSLQVITYLESLVSIKGANEYEEQENS